MKVYVYRNLHKNCFSIKALEGANKGRVIMHTDKVSLYDVTFKVSEKGRQRVLRQKKKYVHAGVVGHILDGQWQAKDVAKFSKIRYNPYETETFQDLQGNPVLTAPVCLLIDNQIFAHIPKEDTL